MRTLIRSVVSPAVLVWVVAHGATAPAITTNWNTDSDGNFNAAANWNNGIPGDADTAVFHRGPNATYTVTLSGGPPQLPPVIHTVDRLVVDANAVSLTRNPILGATSLVAGNATTTESDRGIVVGELGGELATLTTTISVTAVAATIGDAVNSVGVWDVRSSTLTLTGSPEALIVGNKGSGVLDINSGGTLNFGGFANLRIANHVGSAGTMTVSGAQSKLNGDDVILDVGGSGSGNLNVIFGGMLSADYIFIAGNSGSGSANLGSGTVTINDALVHLGTELFVGADGNAQLNIGAGGQVQSTFGFVIGGTSKSSIANINGAGAIWTMSGELDVGQIGPGSTVNHSESKIAIQNGGTVSNGNARVGSPADSKSSVDVFGGTWTITGRLAIGGDVASDTPFGAGTVHVFGGNVSVAGDTVLFPGASLQLAAGSLDAHAMKFEGGGDFLWNSGTLHVAVFNNDLTIPTFGALAPGHDQLPGSTTIVGNLTQSSGSDLLIDIGGTFPGATYDLVGVTGHAVLDGELFLTMRFGFLPNPADTFTILTTGGGIFGIFSDVASGQRLMTTDGRGSFIVNYGAGSPFNQNQVILSAFQATILSGDFDHNGIVDAADYTLWQDTFGQTGSNLPADGDGDHVVDVDDFSIWKSNFGVTFGSGGEANPQGWASTEVPEPACISIYVEFLLIIALRSQISPVCRKYRSCYPGK